MAIICAIVQAEYIFSLCLLSSAYFTGSTPMTCVYYYIRLTLSRPKAFNFYESPDPGNSSCRPFFDDDSDKWLSRLERIIHIYTIYKSELLKTATSDDDFCKNLSRKNTQQYCRRRIKINNIYIFYFQTESVQLETISGGAGGQDENLIIGRVPSPVSWISVAE